MKGLHIKIINLSLLTLLIFSPATIFAKKNPPAFKASHSYSYEMIANQTLVIQSVNKKVITVGHMKYAIGAITKIFDSNGVLVDVSSLQKGMSVSIKFNDQQRYISKPTLSAIYIK